MADTFSAILGFLEQATGNNNNSWGTLLNGGVMDKVDLAVAGVNSQTLTGGTLDLSGSAPPVGPSGAIHQIINLSGTLGSNQIVQVPNLTKTWLVINNTSGAFTLTFKTPSGSASTAIPQNGAAQTVRCDGSNNITVSPFNWKQIQMPDGTVSLPSFSFINNTGMGLYRAGSGDLRVSVGGADVLQLTSGVPTPANAVNIPSGKSLYFNGTLFDQTAVVPTGVTLPFAGINAPSGFYLCSGAAVSRTTDATLFAVICPNQIGGTTVTGNTHTSTTIDNINVDLRGIGLTGAIIEGTGINNGTFISSINSATSITLSQATTSSSSGITLRFLPHGQGDGSTTFNLPDMRGLVPLGRDDMGGTSGGRLPVDGPSCRAMSTVIGEETHLLSSGEMPAHNHPINIIESPHSHTISGTFLQSGGVGASATGVNGLLGVNAGLPSTNTSLTGITATSSNTGGGGGHNNVQPSAVKNFIVKR